MTGRSPGILLIMEREGDRRFLDRVLRVSGELGIDVWTTTPLDLVNNNGLSPN